MPRLDTPLARMIHLRRFLTLTGWTVLVAIPTACDDDADPLAVGGPDTYAEVAVGLEHSCATSRNGTTYCWGRAEKNRLGYLSDRDPCLPDGTVCTRPVPIWGEWGFRDLTLGDAHSCGLLHAQAYCWGWNEFGQLGDAGQVLTRCYGTMPLSCSLEPFPVALGYAVVDIDAGPDHACAVVSVGDAYCWGLNQFGQLGAGHRVNSGTPLRVLRPDGERFESMAAARSHTCALMESGNAYCWGANLNGRLGNGSTIDTLLPVRVSSDVPFTAIDAASLHTCALDREGTPYCWGFYGEGRLGAGPTPIDRTTPYPVDVPEPLVQISTGERHTCGVAADGSLYCWGYNVAGQLGQGPGPDAYSPVETEFPGRAMRVSAGGSHTCALRENGTLFCWGANDSGQLGLGDRTPTAFPARVDRSASARD